MHSIAFYNRSDQRKGKMKPPPNPFTQVQNILRQTHTTTKYFQKNIQMHNKQRMRTKPFKIYARVIKQTMNARIPPLAKVF